MASYQDIMSAFNRVAAVRGIRLRKEKKGTRQRNCSKCNESMPMQESLFSFKIDQHEVEVPVQYCAKCQIAHYNAFTMKEAEHVGMINNPWISLPADNSNSPELIKLKKECAKRQTKANKRDLKKYGIKPGMLKEKTVKQPQEKGEQAKERVTKELTCRGDLYVHKGVIRCLSNKHNVISVTATGPAFWEGRDSVEINVNYCMDCDIMFIGYEEYEWYRKLRKLPIVHFRMTNSDGSFDYNGRAEQSTLFMLGYSVNQEDDLTDGQRQSLLSRVIETGLLSKQEVISHLELLIRTNGKKTDNALAKEKWEKDLHFVMNLGVAKQPKGVITGVTQYGKQNSKTYTPWWED